MIVTTRAGALGLPYVLDYKSRSPNELVAGVRGNAARELRAALEARLAEQPNDHDAIKLLASLQQLEGKAPPSPPPHDPRSVLGMYALILRSAHDPRQERLATLLALRLAEPPLVNELAPRKRRIR